MGVCNVSSHSPTCLLHLVLVPLPPAAHSPAMPQGAYNAAGATVLRRFMEQESMRDSEAWLARLMGEDELLGGCGGVAG